MFLRWIAMMLFWFLAWATASGQEGTRPSRQHFVCHTGFGAEECRSRMKVLRTALNRYHAEHLGEWSWVLVRTTDWKAFLSVRGFDTGSPALTYLPGSETFFDEALTMPDSTRGMLLREIWRISIEELLDKAVRHELAHAFCKEKDEFKAKLLEDQFRSGAQLACRPGKN